MTKKLRELPKARSPKRSLIRCFLLGTVILTCGVAVPFRAASARLQSVDGPVLGFASDGEGTEIRPILGIPGASILGKPLDIPVEFGGVLISAAQDYAIAIRTDDAHAVVIDLSTDPSGIRLVSGANFGADLIAISPVGSVVAIYDELTHTVRVVGGLPSAPGILDIFDASGFPGSVTDIAISDDGSVAIVRSIDGDHVGIWTLDSSGIPRRLPADRPSGSRFCTQPSAQRATPRY